MSFSWPKYDEQFNLNRGDANYDPLFAYGYGLTYQDSINMSALSEKTTPRKNVKSNAQPLFVRSLAKNLTWKLTDSTTAHVLTTGSSATSGDKKSLLMQSVNLSYQEDARQFSWPSQFANATLSLSYLKPELLDSKFNNAYLELKLRLDKAPEQDTKLQLMCNESNCLRSIKFSSLNKVMSDKRWHTLAIPLNCNDGDVSAEITDVLRVTSRHLRLAIADVTLTKKPDNNASKLSCAN